MSLKIGRSHKARKALFTRGLRRGFLTVREIDDALPKGSLSDAERWLLYYSLHAARVEVRDGAGNAVDVEELRPEAADLELEAEAEAEAEGDEAYSDDAAYDG